MQAVDRGLLFVLAFLSMLAVTPLWAEAPERRADATVVAIIDATPETATNIVNTDHTITATATDSISQTPLEGFDVTLEVVTGPNTGATDASVTDVNGQVTLAYTSTGGVGDDSIEVCLFFSQALGNGMPSSGYPRSTVIP